MEKEQRNRLQKATQDARKLLEEEFRRQLLQTYDIDVDKVSWAEEPGAHLQAEQRLIRDKLVAWIEHKEAQINDRKEALLLALREMAFTALNRFVALKLMEARELVRPCVSGGLESAGFLEFTAVAQGLLADQESSYRLYLETIFEDVSRELRTLFDPRDPVSLLWPKRAALLELLEILNRPELAELWIEDETLGWVYQYFNGDAERKKMREESSAPRNSRELAVRNQFFTPRYVVEFLTDNTLGRIWYEMRQGNTGLKDQCRYLVRRPNEVWLQPGEEPPAQPDTDEILSQEELLRQVVYIPHRPLMDPREIRMLDPACGSMHFGLYAFDLYLEIYREAWAIAQGSHTESKHEEALTPFAAYVAGFADKAAFLREIPKLILQHNIHGIDIDPRATQIARLTLWLRAQRAWKEQELEVSDRPRITRSNVVCAEPMPGERQLLADFVDQQFLDAERGLVQQLLETIFDKMQLAGEAGSLLKIEEEIRDAIDQARREWQKLAVHQQNLFSPDELAGLGQATSLLHTGLPGLSKDFWTDIEERIYTALREYSNQVESGGYQKRLFAEDAAGGFAFIDVCRKRYDTVLMNPPFGRPTNKSKAFIDECYGESKHDVAASFVSRWQEKLCHGSLGAITTRNLYYLPSGTQWRRSIFQDHGSLLSFADLGIGVLDAAMVEAAAVVTESDHRPGTAIFADVLKPIDKARTLQSIIKLTSAGESHHDAYLAEQLSFAAIPTASFCYWVPGSIRKMFADSQSVAHVGYECRVGLQSNDDFRWLRLWWEVTHGTTSSSPRQSIRGKWVPYAKGGNYSQYYGELPLVINWHARGTEIKQFIVNGGDSVSRYIRSESHYLLPGITWSQRSQIGLGMRALPEGCIFGHLEKFSLCLGWPARSTAASGVDRAKNQVRANFSRCPFGIKGPVLFGKSIDSLMAMLCVGNSAAFRGLVAMHMSFGSYDTGTVERNPFPTLSDTDSALLSKYATLQHESAQSLRVADETSRCFSVRLDRYLSLKEAANIRSIETSKSHRALAKRQLDIDEIVASAFSLQAVDLASLTSKLRLNPDASESGRNLGNGSLAQPPDQEDNESGGRMKSTPHDAANCHLSLCLGFIYGRWDIRYATNEQNAPELPAPFAPVANCPPGQLQDSQGWPVFNEEQCTSYPIKIIWDGILVTDSGSPRDIEDFVSHVNATIWDGQDGRLGAKVIEHEVRQILGLKTLRDYFCSPAGFFAHHLKQYSQSRRQAPIYWQLSAGSGSYSAWLYCHRFIRDTLYRLQRDFVEPRIQQAERDQFELESQGALSGDAATRLQEAQTLLQDLRIFKSELDLVAPLWNPNLNDGVIINHAILWRITPYTPWQKKCKECWDKLVKGDYDWAHLAFHLWPERVIPKCVTDRSLAIAHGLNERLWQETNNGNWLPRQLSEADLQALIAEHSNPAVKSALERFLAAPPPVAPTRTRASRSTRSSGSSTPRRARGSAAVVDAEATRQVLLALTAAPSDGLAKTAIADLIGVEANALTAVIKQLKESGQIDQLGERRGARYLLSEQGRARLEQEEAT
jgi:hypothetical protein